MKSRAFIKVISSVECKTMWQLHEVYLVFGFIVITNESLGLGT
jgi:hypothetical protein